MSTWAEFVRNKYDTKRIKLTGSIGSNVKFINQSGVVESVDEHGRMSVVWENGQKSLVMASFDLFDIVEKN